MLNNQMIHVFVNPQQKVLLFAVLIIYNCLMVKAFAMWEPGWDAAHNYPPGDTDVMRRIFEQSSIELYDSLPHQYQQIIKTRSEEWLRLNPASTELQRRNAMAHLVNEVHADYRQALRNMRRHNEWSF